MHYTPSTIPDEAIAAIATGDAGIDLHKPWQNDANVRTDALEAAIRRDLAPVVIQEVNYFSKGVYAREIFIPKGTVLTGKIHKYENLNIMSKGDLSVLMDDGSVKRITAPFTVVSPPGTRRVAYAHEDTVWTTIHGTDELDVDKIEEQFIAQTPQDFQLFCDQQLQIKG